MPTPQISEQTRLAMARTNDLFNSEVFLKGNLALLDDIYTTDARILPPGAPMITGRAGIKDFWANVIKTMNAKSAVLTSVDVTPAGDGLLEIGRAVLTIQPQSGATTEVDVKYVVYWRQEGGNWKWHVDIWNMNT
jgi:ketosteroid isomerase-like protein